VNRSSDNQSDAPAVRQAVIVAGGRGSRLGALTAETPKPLLDVGGRPFVEHLLFDLARGGIEEIVLLVGPYREAYQRALRPEHRRAPRLILVPEPAPAGTAGALWYARKRLAKRFYLLNGDSILDGNLLRLDARRRDAAHRAGASTPVVGAVAVLSVPDTARFGRIDLAGDRIAGFREKGHAGAGLVNAGIYLFDREPLLARIAKPPCSLEREILPVLAAERALVAVKYQGRFVDIGIPASLAEAQRMFPAWHRRPAILIALDALVMRGGAAQSRALRWRQGARAALRRINDAGSYAIVLAPGTAARAETLRRRLNAVLMREGTHIDALYTGRAASAFDPLLRAARAEWPIAGAGRFIAKAGARRLEEIAAAARNEGP
jgi:D-glycero-D-manno-heptose 1,7-bisphosphate phosphatase